MLISQLKSPDLPSIHRKAAPAFSALRSPPLGFPAPDTDKEKGAPVSRSAPISSPEGLSDQNPKRTRAP